MIAPGSLLKTVKSCMISFVLSYDAPSAQEMSLDVSLVSRESALWVGRAIPTAVEIASGDDHAQS
jgi:hypothetical protein